MAFTLRGRQEKKESSTNRPTKSAPLTDNLVASIWESDTDEGKRYNFKIERVNPKNDAKPYRTLRVRDLVELPQFVASLAGSFARDEDIPSALRAKLARLAALMEEAQDLLGSEGYRQANGEDSPSELGY